jgi:hypothetical protein
MKYAGRGKVAEASHVAATRLIETELTRLNQ